MRVLESVRIALYGGDTQITKVFNLILIDLKQNEQATKKNKYKQIVRLEKQIQELKLMAV
jgi:hypothetical protein